MKTIVSKFAMFAAAATLVSAPAFIISSSSAFADCGCYHSPSKARSSGWATSGGNGTVNIYAGTAVSDSGGESGAKSKSTGSKSTSASGDTTFYATANGGAELHHGHLKSAWAATSSGGSTSTTANTGN